jgi:hypothetical protein
MRFIFWSFRLLFGLSALGILFSSAGCGSGTVANSTPVILSISMSSTSVVVAQDGMPVQVPLAITGPTGTAMVEISGLPTGVSGQFTATSGGPSGTLTFTGSATTAAGNYPATVLVSLQGQTVSQSFTVTSAVEATVSSATDTTVGVAGQLTSLQVAEWTAGFFGTDTATNTARENTLNSLEPQHIRLQAVSEGVAMQANTGLASDWNFTLLDQTVQPILASADKSPEFQIAVAPAWMCDSNGRLDMANHLNDFAAYASNLVRYYNKGGFTWGGQRFQSASSQPIVWWGIFNEPNQNGLTAAEYVQLYNAVVPAMLAVDPTIKLSAFEFSDYGLGSGGEGDPEQYLPTFISGVNTQVDVISTHLYGTCNQLTTDAELFSAVPQFAANVQYLSGTLQASTNMPNVPVWVTENNVNADYADANGMSVCNPGQPFVLDLRATDAFFAAWRPYVFSRLGKAGNQSLNHWEYTGGPEYDEVDSSGNTFLSYWIDKALANYFPSTPTSPRLNILSVTATDTSSVETLATLNSNGIVTVMVVDLAVHSTTDNNGSGVPRTVVVDTSSLGSFTAASLMTIDAATSASNGPSGIGITPASRINVTLPGYGVAFLRLTP